MTRVEMDPSLAVCVAECAGNAEFVANWLRLRGYTLPTDAISRMVDEATGHIDAIAAQFIADVKDLVLDRLQGQPA